MGIAEKHPWTALWWRRGCVVADTETGSFEFKEREGVPPDDQRVPRNILALGCAGWDAFGRLHWVGWDFDVGKGKVAKWQADLGMCEYATRDDAIAAARRLRDALDRQAEIRLSRSGRGVHVRHLLPQDEASYIKRDKASAIARGVAAMLKIYTDPAQLGRQCLALWCRRPSPDSFRLIEEGVWSGQLAPLISEAMEKPDPRNPIVRPIPTTFDPDRNRVIARARKYLAVMDPAVEGQNGHTQLFYAACILVKGFGLTPGEARPLFVEYNARCLPPENERQVEHKLAEALRQNGPVGYMLAEDQSRQYSYSQQYRERSVEGEVIDGEGPELAEQESTDGARDALPLSAGQTTNGIYEEILAGRRKNIQLPWRLMTSLTQALLPGTITMLCAPQGASKTFMCHQIGQFFIANKVPYGMMMLEDSRSFHCMRALAQITENDGLIDYEWIANHPEEVRAACAQHQEYLDVFGANIFEAPDNMNAKSLLAWIRYEVEMGKQVLVIDPISAKSNAGQIWVEDHDFMFGAKKIIESSGARLILTTHPRQSQKLTEATTAEQLADNMCGGKAYAKFSHAALYMERVHPSIKVACKTPEGICDAVINRRIMLAKTRQGKGQGAVLGFYFSGKSLTFQEKGVVLRK